jgi:hypothetical protein
MCADFEVAWGRRGRGLGVSRVQALLAVAGFLLNANDG